MSSALPMEPEHASSPCARRSAPHKGGLASIVVLVLGILYTSLAHYGALDCRGWIAHLLTESVALQWSDALGNVIAYALLGAAIAATGAWDATATGPGKRPGRGLLRTLVACAALSLSIEATQACLTERFSSATDLLLNTLGGGAGWLLMRKLRVTAWPWARRHAAQVARAPRRYGLCALAILAWSFSATAPWRLPTPLAEWLARLHNTWDALLSAQPDPWRLLAAAGTWLALGLAYASVQRHPHKAWWHLAALGLVVSSVQGLLPTADHAAPEALGALLMTLPVVALVARTRPRVCAAGALLGALLATLATQLEPGYGSTQAFRWRVLLLHGDAIAGLQEAAWYVWLALTVVVSGTAWSGSAYRWAWLTPAVLAVLAGVQTAVPGRNPDLSGILFTGLSGMLAARALTAKRHAALPSL